MVRGLCIRHLPAEHRKSTHTCTQTHTHTHTHISELCEEVCRAWNSSTEGSNYGNIRISRLLPALYAMLPFVRASVRELRGHLAEAISQQDTSLLLLVSQPPRKVSETLGSYCHSKGPCRCSLAAARAVSRRRLFASSDTLAQ